MMGMPDISGVVDSMKQMQEQLPALASNLDRLLAIEERQAVALEAIASLLNQNTGVK